MTSPDSPDRQSKERDIAQLHAALHGKDDFLAELGLNVVAPMVRELVRQFIRESVEFAVGKVLVRACTDEQLKVFEDLVRSHGTDDALRWLYGDTPADFHMALRQAFARVRSDLRQQSAHLMSAAADSYLLFPYEGRVSSSAAMRGSGALPRQAANNADLP